MRPRPGAAFFCALSLSFRRQLTQQPFCNKDRGRAAELGGLAAAGRPNRHQALWRHAVRAFDQTAKKYGVELPPNSSVSFHVLNLVGAAPGVHPAKATFVTDFRVFSGQSA